MKNLVLSLFLLITANELAVGQNELVAQLIDEGIALHNIRQFSEAINKYKQALSRDPGSVMARYETARSYYELKVYDSAVWFADQVILQGDDGMILEGMIVKGSCLDERGNSRESLGFYENALLKYPDNYLLLYHYALSCEKAGMNADAEAAFEKALKNKTSHPDSNLRLALLKAGNGEKAPAIFGLYYFLLLENNTPRAKEALKTLLTLFYGSAAIEKVNVDDNGTMSINIPPAWEEKEDGRDKSAELVIMMVAGASSGTNQAKSFEEKFIGDTQDLFGIVASLKYDVNAKNKNDGTTSFSSFWDVYVPYFNSLSQTEHMDAFCYHILKASDDPRISSLAEQHKHKLEFFHLWMYNH
jgi:tetratricopeptide (TPR) repeat protein